MAEQKHKHAELPASDVKLVPALESTETIYIDGAQGLLFVNGVMKINLYQVVQDFNLETGESDTVDLRRLIVARLAMSPIVARQLGTWLVEQTKSMPEQAFDGDRSTDGKKG